MSKKKYWEMKQVQDHAKAVAQCEAFTVELDEEEGRFNWNSYRSECKCTVNMYCEKCLTAAVEDQREVCTVLESNWEQHIDPETSNKRQRELEIGWENMFNMQLPKAIKRAVLAYGSELWDI